MAAMRLVISPAVLVAASTCLCCYLLVCHKSLQRKQGYRGLPNQILPWMCATESGFAI